MQLPGCGSFWVDLFSFDLSWFRFLFGCYCPNDQTDIIASWNVVWCPRFHLEYILILQCDTNSILGKVLPEKLWTLHEKCPHNLELFVQKNPNNQTKETSNTGGLEQLLILLGPNRCVFTSNLFVFVTMYKIWNSYEISCVLQHVLVGFLAL